MGGLHVLEREKNPPPIPAFIVLRPRISPPSGGLGHGVMMGNWGTSHQL